MIEYLSVYRNILAPLHAKYLLWSIYLYVILTFVFVYILRLVCSRNESGLFTQKLYPSFGV